MPCNALDTNLYFAVSKGAEDLVSIGTKLDRFFHPSQVIVAGDDLVDLSIFFAGPARIVDMSHGARCHWLMEQLVFGSLIIEERAVRKEDEGIHLLSSGRGMS